MGIILSCFTGIGASYLINTCQDAVKILDVRDVDTNELYQTISDNIEKYDIIITKSTLEVIRVLDANMLNYDLFYPSKERKQEFIINMVRKHVPSSQIREIDMQFDSMVDSLDNIESNNAYKHKLNLQGMFLGNDIALRGYINSVSSNKE